MSTLHSRDGRGPVVVLSHPGDLHATTVLEAMKKRGTPAFLFDLSDLPAKQTITIEHSADGPRLRVRHHELGVIDLTNARSVWWRRPQLVDLESITDPKARGFCYGEWHEGLHGFYSLLNAPWMNPLVADQLASHKAFQLAVAPQVGLRVPATVMTSDAAEARAFAAERGPGGTVYKIFAATYEVWRETRVLSEADLGQLGSLHLAPVIFQECVPGVADIRVTVVGDEMFAIAIEGDADDQIDFRLRMRQAGTRPVRVPDEIAAGLRALMHHFGIVYGGADFRLTPEGEWVFLEINPAGEFLFVEYGGGHPITEAMASWLSDPPAARPAAQPTRFTSTLTSPLAAVSG